jgi:hypothetical protein
VAGFSGSVTFGGARPGDQGSQSAEVVGEDVWRDDVQTLYRLAETITAGMTAARRDVSDGPTQQGELTALACLTMLERVNYLISVGVRLPRDEMAKRLSVILYAAFPSAELAGGQTCIDRE